MTRMHRNGVMVDAGREVVVSILLLTFLGSLFLGMDDPAKPALVPKKEPTMDDVKGCANAQKKLQGYIRLLRQPSLVRDTGLQVIPGLVLHGPDGTGKRTMARAIAAEANGKFVELDMEMLVVSMMRLDTSDAFMTISDALSDPNDSVPTVIFVKRADYALLTSFRQDHDGASVTRTSCGHGATREDARNNERLLHVLFHEHEKASRHARVPNKLLILSTSHRLRRPSSALNMMEQISFHYPDRKTRASLFRDKLKKVGAPYGESEEQLYKLASMTHGLNGQDISQICMKALMTSLAQDLAEVNQRTVEEAVNEVRKNRPAPSNWERETVAYHEAGHAVVAWKLEHAKELIEVSVVPDGSGALGYTLYNNRDRVFHTSEEVFDTMAVAVAGRYSELHFTGCLTTGAQNDIAKVTKLAYLWSAVYGLNGSNISIRELAAVKSVGLTIRKKIDRDIKEVIAKAVQVAQDMVLKHSDDIDKVAQALLDRDTLSSADMTELLGPTLTTPCKTCPLRKKCNNASK